MSTRQLPTFRFDQPTCIARALPRPTPRVQHDSPAVTVMTDLADVRAAAISPERDLDQAEAAMIQHGVRMLFVVGTVPCVDGIVTLGDLHGDKAICAVQDQRIPRAMLRVADVMTPLCELELVALHDLERGRVADVLATLEAQGSAHLVVVEAGTARSAPRVRGVVSRAQVERQLGIGLPAVHAARNFAELERALA